MTLDKHHICIFYLFFNCYTLRRKSSI